MQTLEEEASLRKQVQLLLEVAELGEQRTLLLLLLLLVERMLLQERRESQQWGEPVQGERVEQGQLQVYRARVERVEGGGWRIGR